MAFRIISNKQGKNVVLWAGANNTISPGDALLAVNGEVIRGLTIRSIQYGSDPNGTWIVNRDANTVFVFGRVSGFQDFAGVGMPLNLDSVANVSVTLLGTANGTIMLDLQKQYNLANNAAGANTSY